MISSSCALLVNAVTGSPTSSWCGKVQTSLNSHTNNNYPGDLSCNKTKGSPEKFHRRRGFLSPSLFSMVFGKIKGLTMVEVMVALSLSAAISIGAFMMASWNLQEASGARVRTELIDIGSRVRETFGHSSDYSRVTTARVIAAKIIPDQMLSSASTVVHSLGGRVFIDGRNRTTPKDFIIFANFVNQRDCRTFFGGIVIGPRGLYGVDVRPGTITSSTAAHQPLGGFSKPRNPTPADVSSKCSTGATTALLFFR